MALNSLIPHSTLGMLNFKGKALLLAEASTMQLRLEQLYDDAADVGLALKSHKTGEVTTWHLLEVIRDRRENEILGWMLAPTADTLLKFPELKGWQLNVEND